MIALYENTAVLVLSTDDYEGTARIMLDSGKEKTVPTEQIQFRWDMYILSHKNHLTGTHNASDAIINSMRDTMQMLGLSLHDQSVINREMQKAIRKELRDNWFPDYFFYQTQKKLEQSWRDIKEIKKDNK